MLSDVREFADKLGVGSEMYRTCLAESVIEISKDSTRIRVTVPNTFYKTMLDNDAAKMSISKAAILMKVTSSVPTVEIKIADVTLNSKQNNPFNL